jgi:hypothetical protein
MSLEPGGGLSVAAMKFVHPGNNDPKETVRREAENWNAIYSDYSQRFEWKVRMEVWMGEAAVVMPLVFQFTTSQERLDNLEKVRSCL